MSGTRSPFRAAVLFGLALCLAGVGRVVADVIHLRNGKTLQGLVQEETPHSVTLSLGSGSITIRRSKIERVERNSANANARLREAWRRSHILHEEYAPPGLEDLAAQYRRLTKSRRAAVDARRRLVANDAAERKLIREADVLRNELVTLARRLQVMQPEQDIEAYNAAVVQSNSLRNRTIVSEGELRALRGRRGKSQDWVAEYVEQLQALDAAVVARKPAAAADDDVALFFEQIETRLRTYEKEFIRVGTVISNEGVGAVAAVRINDRVTGRFIVDTGAALVTISKALAARLQIDMAGRPQTDVVLADGAVVRAQRLVLDSMQVGDARAEAVEAVVLGATGGEGIDGLLGMSFLRRFVVNFDGGTGRLVLKQFQPR